MELWHNSLSDSDSEKTSTLSLFVDENDNRTACSNIDHDSTVIASDSDVEDLITDEKLLGDGSDEDDTLLVIYQDASSVYWQ